MNSFLLTKVVRTAVILDAIGTGHQSPTAEMEAIIADFAGWGLDLDVVHFSHQPLDLPETQIDLLVVDYGALWPLDLGDWTRGLLHWAEEHPSALVAIWSMMTADFFITEMGGHEAFTAEGREGRTWPANVRAMHIGNKYLAARQGDPLGWQHATGTDWYAASVEFIRSWFGLPPAAPKHQLVAPGWNDEI